MKIRKPLWLVIPGAVLFLFACVTINIYFPAEKVESVAGEIVDEIRGQGGGEEKSPAEQKDSFLRKIRLAFTPDAAWAQDAVEVSNPTIRALKEQMKGPDKVLILDKPELLKGTVNTMSEALRPGIVGVHHEAGLYTRPWGFRLQDIAAEVHLWHGEQDDNVPVSVGRYVADAIPNCRAKFIENEGHLTLIRKYVREYLSVLVA